MKKPQLPFQILIVDLGSQFTMLINRTLRELGYRSTILPPKKAEKWLNEYSPKAIILSGGSGSVYEEGCPTLPPNILELGVPVLGICLGMQWIVTYFGGQVSAENLLHKEYGPTSIIQDTEHFLFKGLKSENTVWANHGDSVQKLPHDFMQIAQSQDHETIQAITNSNGSIIGVQFHPEVHHTISGNTMLLNFVKKAGCTPDWDPADIADSIRQEIADAVKNESGTKKVILGLSGGVDSSVTAALLHPILGDNLLCVVIDSGFLREGEPDEIKRTANLLGVNYIVIESEKRFYEALGGTTEPETKRAIFKRVYREILEEHIASFEADFIVQGSLATDFIESGKAGDSALIKSHHNIGIQWSVAEIHPLRTLFKYEVREIGQTLGLPDYITKRQPFPGPGLMVRVVGIPANPENTAIIRHCDIIVRRVLEKHQLYDQISQLVVYLSGTQTVGIKGDGRSYGYAAVLRPISTQDFMTCTVLDIPRDVIDEICTQVTKHSKITRLLYDYTPKPPGTTEAE